MPLHLPGSSGGSSVLGDPAGTFEQTGSAATALAISGLPTSGLVVITGRIINGAASNCDYTLDLGLTGMYTKRIYGISTAVVDVKTSCWIASAFASKEVDFTICWHPDLSPGATNRHRWWHGVHDAFSTDGSTSLTGRFSGRSTDTSTASPASFDLDASVADGIGVGSYVEVFYA